MGAGNDEPVFHTDPAHHIAAFHQEGQVGFEDVVQDAVMGGARNGCARPLRRQIAISRGSQRDVMASDAHGDALRLWAAALKLSMLPAYSLSYIDSSCNEKFGQKRATRKHRWQDLLSSVPKPNLLKETSPR